MTRDPTEEARECPAQRKPADRSAKTSQRGNEFEEGEGQDQQAHDELARCDQSDAVHEGPGDKRRLTGQRRESDRAKKGRDYCRNTEAKNDVARRPAGKQTHLEDIVGGMNYGCRGHGDLDWEEEGECRHQQRAKAEAREQREERHAEGCEPHGHQRSQFDVSRRGLTSANEPRALSHKMPWATARVGLHLLVRPQVTAATTAVSSSIRFSPNGILAEPA